MSCAIIRWKVIRQGHASHWKFLPCPLCSSVRFLPIYFICCTHTTHWVTMCRPPLPGQKVKGQCHAGHWNFLPRPLSGSSPIWPIHFIWGTHTTHDVTMCRAAFVGQKVKGQGHAVIRNLCHVPSNSPSLFDQLFRQWGGDVSVSFAGQRIIVQGHTGRSYVSCGPLVANMCRNY